MLKYAEANLSALIENTQDLIWSVDLDYRLIAFNPALRQYILNNYGARLAEGMCFHEVLPLEQAELWPVFYERLLAEGPFQVEYSRIDGCIMELAFNPIAVDGDIMGISIIGMDITQRKKSESALKEAEANLSALIESTEDLIWSVDLDYRLITFNQALQQNIQNNFGVQVAPGMIFHEALTPERAVLWPPYYARVLAEGPFQIEYTRADNGIMELAFNPIVVDGVTTGISIFGKEITEQRKAAESRRFLAEVVESCEEAIITNAPSGEILSWNHGAESIYGYSAAEMIGKPFSIIIAPEIRELAERQLGELINGAPLLETQGVALRKDGSRAHVSVTTWPMRNSAGEVRAICTIVRDISAHHEAEKNRALLASVVESSGDLIHAVNLDGTIVSWNRGAERMTGYTSEEILGKSATMIVPPGHEEYVRKNLKTIRDGRTAGPIDVVLQRKDGSAFDVSLTLSPIRNAEGAVVGAAAIARDISERKKIEREIREAEKKYRDIFEGALEGMSQATLEGKFLSANPAAARMLGYDSAEELISMAADLAQDVWVNPADRAQYLRLLEEHVSVRGFECQLKRKDGRHIWVSLNDRMICGADGRLLYLEGFMEDITGRKQAEERLAAATEALRVSEEHYRSVFQTSIDAISVTHEEDGRIVDVNQEYLRMFGVEREEVIGKTTQELFVWTDPQDRRKLVEALRKDTVIRDLEFILQRKNGQRFWVQVSGSRIDLEGIPSFLIVVRDISVAKAAAEALRLSEVRYRTAFQTSLDAITINRIGDGMFIDCNQACIDTLGYTREEILGRTSLELGIWADNRDRDVIMDMLRRDSSLRGFEVQIRKKNGEVIWGEMSASLMEIGGVPCILTITRDLTDTKAAEKTIRNLAFYDPLTGLPNRRMLMERLRHPLAGSALGGRSQALLLIDLDHFKTLNDTLGHQTGDLMLQMSARRIVGCTREADTVCRLGGDEFVVVLEELSKFAEEAAAQAQAVGEKILAAINQPCLLDDHECHSTASIGIAVFGVRQDSTDDILQQADIALYQAKAAGRNTLRFFSPALQAAVNARAAMEEDLRQGIKEKQFLLYYQPQVERGRLTGAEALVRWMHPKRGLVPPNDFIPPAEESRLILPLGDWVLEAACQQIALWAGRKEAAHLSVAVNISALQFRQPSFVEQVLATLSRTGANPNNLKLELTESMLVENLDDIIAKMNELRSHGLRFSLDDFGTGYSSLSYLKRLPLDRLKIDRSFVRDMLVDPTSGAIAQTILSLGRAMGISVIAEGVETEEQRGYLAGLGCHSFQGFLFSRPLPLEQFEAYMLGFADYGSSS
jgi:diguanylate cyclase (GGDEF)-like protein/PAS domain S-box-containing protein